MKVLFLVQSCNKERYIQEEELIRNTWGKRIWKDCDLFFYRGDGENILDGDVLKLKCGDELKDTFSKTIMALTVFKNSNYDFIVRTNTSNWINVDYLMEILSQMNKNKRELVGCQVVTNNSSEGIPFIRGNFWIFNEQIQQDIYDSITNTKYYKGIDDVCLCFNLVRYYNRIGVDYLDCLKVLSSTIIEDINEKIDFTKTVCIRCAEYIKKKESSDVIKEVDEKYIESLKIKLPQKFKKIETVFGDIKY